MKLDEKHLLVYDENNVTLRFQENRIRKKNPVLNRNKAWKRRRTT